MLQTNKSSLFVSLVFIFLLPIFFIPGTALGLGAAKSALLVVGTAVLTIVFLFSIWKSGRLSLPWHLILAFLIFLPTVYLVSALVSTPSSLSLLGYNFEIGTFGYILIGSLLVLLVSSIFSDTTRVLQALVAFFLSISVLALFVLIKVFSGGDVLVLGNFSGNMANPIGSWTDLAIVFGLLSAFSALAVGLLPMKLSARLMVYAAFLAGLFLMIVVNFTIAFALTLAASLFLILYFWKLEKRFSSAETGAGNFFTKPLFLPIVLAAVSLVFLVNPTLSDTRGTVGDVVANTFSVQNVDVRPSLSATLGVSKAVLLEKSFLGSGPNTFDRDWLIYKTAEINTTPFWAISFPFGVGFLPTQVATTGALGTVAWLAFFVTLIVLVIKSLMRLPESRAERFTTVSAVFIVLFLWASSFVYAPSATVLIFAFIFSGLLLAANQVSHVVSSRPIGLKDQPRNKIVSFILVVAVFCGAVYLGWSSYSRTVAAYHFKKAVDLANVDSSSLDEIERFVNKAISSMPTDTYYVALSRINFVKAQNAINATEGTPDENQAVFETSLRQSIENARLATQINPAGYQNWISLGLIYSALVPPPLSVSGAYENASVAYDEAKKLNPLNPEVPLFRAQLELNNNDQEAAISEVRKAIALKQDYADAFLLLAQLEIQAGNTAAAIESAEQLAALAPDNPGIYFELGVLKYSNRDYAGAEKTFRQALAITPDYANAQYYLGLSLAQLDRLDEAIEQFEALLRTNPDNADVISILEDLRDDDTSFLNRQ
ncbi:MAG: tetratricopeptide repeat protein [Minisyncoccia bacterium]